MRNKFYLFSMLSALMLVLASTVPVKAQQTNPYKTPLYWTVYEYNYNKEQQGVSDNYIPEADFKANIDWLSDNMKSYGYNMVCIDGWGDVNINENGYRTKHSSHWENDYAWWSQYLQSKGMTLGMYENPLWIHVDQNDTTRKIVGTDILVSSIRENVEGTFNWVDVTKPGAEQYVKGYVKYYADMGVKFLRVDFLSWYETGKDRNLGTVGRTDRPHADYVTALKWMREACDQYGVYLSLVMPNLYNDAEVEKVYGHMFRINSDVFYGTWDMFSDNSRGIHFSDWSQYVNAFDGYIYWSKLTGKNKVSMDGDFIRLNTFANDTEKRSVISLHLVAGGPIAIADQYNTIGNDAWLYQNEELLALNTAKFTGKPLSGDPTNTDSQTWTGQLDNGDWIVAFFNRESTAQTRSLDFKNKLGVLNPVMVRDLWQHKNIGKLSNIQVTLPPHGCLVVKLVKGSTENPTLQTISFPTIPNKVIGTDNSTFTAGATATSGLPVEYEIASGPAKIVNGQIQLTGYDGTVFVIAKQSGNATYGAAVPVIQSFTVTGGRDNQLYVAGDFSGWALQKMTSDENIWKYNTVLYEGANEIKFANTSDWSGKDWGNANGLSGTANETTGGGANIKFNVSVSGNYTITFNDVTKAYSIIFTPVHQANMYVAGTFSSTQWAPQQMTLENDVWVKKSVPLTAGDYELKFANTTNWSGKDWGNASGLSGTATETTGGGDNVVFTIPASGNYDIYFNDMTLQYVISTSLAVDDLSRNKGILLYPNPATEKVFIRSSGDSVQSYQIYDLGGKLLQSQKVDCRECEVNVSGLTKGVYIISFDMNGQKVSRKIIIK